MKDKNMSVDDFYSRIRENAEITFEALLKEWILYTAVSSTDGYKITYGYSSGNNRNHILKFAKMWNQKITRIGNITGVRGNYLKFNNQLKKIKDYQGYIHNFK